MKGIEQYSDIEIFREASLCANNRWVDESKPQREVEHWFKVHYYLERAINRMPEGGGS